MKYSIWRLVRKCLVATTKALHLDMHHILYQRQLIVEDDDEKYSPEGFSKLNALQQQAAQCGHHLEELVLLTDEYKSAFKRGDSEQLAQVKGDMIAVAKHFELSDEECAQWYETTYLARHPSNYKKAVALHTTFLFEVLQGRADFLCAHGDFKSGLICANVMYKVASSLGLLTLEDKLENIYTLAVNYSYATNYEFAFRYYNVAIWKTVQAEDDFMLLIAVLRKWSVCMYAAQVQPSANYDAERFDAEQRLRELCAKYQLNPEELSEHLLQVDAERLRENPTLCQSRKERMEEAIVVLPQILAATQGDSATAQYYQDKAREVEIANYGGDGKGTFTDQMMNILSMLVDVDEAKQDETSQPEDSTEIQGDAVPDLSGMLPFQQFMALSMGVPQCLGKGQVEGARLITKRMVALTETLHSVYWRATAEQSKLAIDLYLGDLSAGVAHCRRTLDILSSADASSDADLSPYLRRTTLGYLGKLLLDLRDFPGAIDCFTQVIEEQKDDAMVQANLLGDLYLSRGNARLCNDEKEKAEDDFLSALKCVTEETRARLPFMEADLREQYWKGVLTIIYKVMTLVDDDSSEALKVAAYNAVLLSKGILLSAEKSLKSLIETDERLAPLRPIYDELVRQESSAMSLGLSPRKSSSQYVAWYMKKAELMHAIKDKIRGCSDYLDFSFHDLQRMLSPGQVIVDFFDIDTLNDDRRYMAFIVSSEMKAPHIVWLCKESDLSALFKEACGSTDSGEATLPMTEVYNPRKPFSAALAEMLWHPILRVTPIPAESEVFFVPSGTLSTMAMESLVIDKDGTAFLDTSYRRFSRLSHARAVDSAAVATEDYPYGAVLFGGLDYEQGETTDEEPSRRGSYAHLGKTEATPLRPWPRLRGTGREVDDIAYLWQATRKEPMACSKGLDGTVESFKLLSGHAPSLLHLATHGFFESAQTAVNLPALRGGSHPLHYSGIILANGNRGWMQGDKDHHEGVLTAKEISQLDLSHTQLVILSACDTGNGMVATDGLFGLQRAFKKAGAASIITSLWGEDDTEGYMMMIYFYTELLGQGKDKYTAFQTAKQLMRERHPHPFYWAGFIMLD